VEPADPLVIVIIAATPVILADLQRVGIDVALASFDPGWSWFAGDAAAEVNAEFANGTRFVFSGSWCSPGLETSWNGSWRISGADGTALWDGDHAPVAQTADGTPIAAVVGTGPEEIAGSLAEFVSALRDGSVPSGEVHSNVMSLATVEGAIRSARTRQRVFLGDLLEEAYRLAVAAEQATRSWGSAGVLAVRARCDRRRSPGAPGR
jgi:predicted dehydrogenase